MATAVHRLASIPASSIEASTIPPSDAPQQNGPANRLLSNRRLPHLHDRHRHVVNPDTGFGIHYRPFHRLRGGTRREKQ